MNGTSRPGAALSSSTMEPLWEALGRPARHLLIPPTSSLAWRAFRLELASALRRCGCNNRYRSPRQLWNRLHGTPLPRMAKWEDLLRDADWEKLKRVAPRGEGCVPLFSWNIRWLVDLNTNQARAKTGVLQEMIYRGSIVMMQETHWKKVSEQLSALTLEGGTMVSSIRDETRGRSAAGVAMVVPTRYKVQGHTVLSEGRAILADVDYEGQTVRLLSLYLPPGEIEPTIQDLERNLDISGPPLFVMGDLLSLIHI